MHAVSYGLCKEPVGMGCDQTPDKCGFRLDHNISIWRSRSMASGSWEYVSLAVAPSERPAGIVYRPHLVYNPYTRAYVLWFNYVLPSGGYAGYAAATSASPAGPFVVVNTLVNTTRGPGAGDFDLFVDPSSGAGYVIYSSQYWMSVEALTPDFLYSTGRSSALFPEYFVEAPVMFLRGGRYYALFGHCCCFCSACQQYSKCRVHYAVPPCVQCRAAACSCTRRRARWGRGPRKRAAMSHAPHQLRAWTRPRSRRPGRAAFTTGRPTCRWQGLSRTSWSRS